LLEKSLKVLATPGFSIGPSSISDRCKSKHLSCYVHQRKLGDLGDLHGWLT